MGRPNAVVTAKGYGSFRASVVAATASRSTRRGGGALRSMSLHVESKAPALLAIPYGALVELTVMEWFRVTDHGTFLLTRRESTDPSWFRMYLGRDPRPEEVFVRCDFESAGRFETVREVDGQYRELCPPSIVPDFLALATVAAPNGEGVPVGE